MSSERGCVRLLDVRGLKRRKFLLYGQFARLAFVVLLKKERLKLYGRSLLQGHVSSQIKMANQF